MARPRKSETEKDEGASAPSTSESADAKSNDGGGKKVKVKLLCSMAEDGANYAYGDEVELDADHAERLIASGGAEKA